MIQQASRKSLSFHLLLVLADARNTNSFGKTLDFFNFAGVMRSLNFNHGFGVWNFLRLVDIIFCKEKGPSVIHRLVN